MFHRLTIGLLAIIFFSFTCMTAHAQLQVTQSNNAQALAQKLVGDGVIISNATLTNSPSIVPTGFFNNLGNTNIGIDSGIVITSGRAKTDFRNNLYGVDGNGTFAASTKKADNNLGLPGDMTLATELGIPVSQLNDAIALEFDFVPLGDTIKFNYVMSSEEYTPGTVCVFNDAFGFFISGPGIVGTKNIALIPFTNTPVTITNVNNVIAGGCVNNPQYFIDNNPNLFFTYDGLTTVFTAISAVIPCQTYHLKLVIADRGDHAWDSGVFLQARSLSSNVISMNNQTESDNQGNSYLVEGCVSGSFTVRRPRKESLPLSVSLSYGGTAQNGIDVQTLPSVVTIPADDSFVVVNVIPIVDGIPEGTEILKVYALGGCASGAPTDSTLIQIRDYDTLAILPASGYICRNGSVQLTALAGYTTYQWNTDPSLSNTAINNPIATPVNHSTTYICTAVEGTCNRQDSVVLQWKDMEFLSKLDVNCKNGATGNIKVAGGPEWIQPAEFSIDGINWQADSSFYNLPTGNYTVRIRDAVCRDSIAVTINQAFPDLVISNLATTAASCSGAADGLITVTASGGNNPYFYSTDGVIFQPTNTFNLAGGNYNIYIKDNNGCTASQNNITIPLNNIVTLDAGPDLQVCVGRSVLIPAVSNGSSFAWSPAIGLDNVSLLTPTSTPPATTKYYVTATTGICTKTDSVNVIVLPSPVADAGTDIDICNGKVFQLSGSGGVSYQWSPSTYFISGSTVPNPSVKATNTITYHLTVTNAQGCESLTPDDITVHVTPSVRIFAGHDTIAAINQPMQLNAVELNNAGVTQYTWSPANFLNDPNSASPVAILPNDYHYTVTGTTPDGCQGTDDINIKVYQGPEIYVPSGFTPDNNGLNDVLKAIPVGIKDFHYLRVFNRWGQLIFSTSDPSRGWDGKIKGMEQATGSYIWIAEAVDYKGNLVSRRGVVTVVR